MPGEQTRVRGAVGLRHVNQEVAEYVWQPVDLPRHVSPRPFLHPVRTLGGVAVTELMPADHPHHLGVSIAVPDLAGHNFWGGRTYVRAQGPTLLDNHGTQRHEGWLSRTPGSIVAALAWAAPDGTVLLRERRRMAALPIAAQCWALDLSFELTNVTAEPLAFASPATNGRPDAGYGGFFWRAPRGTARTAVFGPCRRGVRHLHGHRGDWLALTGATGADARWTLVFVPVEERARADRWFARTGDYPGVGSCLAWERPLVVPTGGTLRRRIITIVADGTLTVDRAARLAGAATAHATDG
jgi:hypothetical protein